MGVYRVEVRVMPRESLLDPQGQAVHHALTSLGFGGVSRVRVGRAIVLTLEAETAEAAEATSRAMCEKLLANPVTEDFAVVVTEEV